MANSSPKHARFGCPSIRKRENQLACLPMSAHDSPPKRPLLLLSRRNEVGVAVPIDQLVAFKTNKRPENPIEELPAGDWHGPFALKRRAISTPLGLTSASPPHSCLPDAGYFACPESAA